MRSFPKRFTDRLGYKMLGVSVACVAIRLHTGLGREDFSWNFKNPKSVQGLLQRDVLYIGAWALKIPVEQVPALQFVLGT